jgi:hypothetical protein
MRQGQIFRDEKWAEMANSILRGSKQAEIWNLIQFGPTIGNQTGCNLFISLFSHYSFPSNPLLSAYFMEIKQILTREIDAWFGMMQQPKKIFLGFTIIT